MYTACLRFNFSLDISLTAYPMQSLNPQCFLRLSVGSNSPFHPNSNFLPLRNFGSSLKAYSFQRSCPSRVNLLLLPPLYTTSRFSSPPEKYLNGRGFPVFAQRQPWLEFEEAVAERDMARAFDLLEVIDRDIPPGQSTPESLKTQSQATNSNQPRQLDRTNPFRTDDNGNQRVEVEVVVEEREREKATDDSEIFLRSESSLRSLRLLDAALTATDMQLVLSAYDWLKNRGMLPNFGSFVPDSSQAQRLVTPAILKSSAGLEASKLSPKRWGSSNPWAPILVLGVFSALVNNGIDIRPIVTAVLCFAIVDAVSLGGTGFSQLMSFWRPYKRRVMVHEAGHVLVAYLLGCPVRGVVLDAMEALRLGIQGQAGTQFWDSTLEEELRLGRLTSASIDRYCIVVFAGIAAEAMVYGEAEGGESDENLYKAMVGQLQPVWPPAKISNQARWSVLQAFLLLKEHKKAHEAVVNALEEGASMGDLAKAIENAMAESY